MGIFGKKWYVEKHYNTIRFETGKDLLKALVDKLNSMGLKIESADEITYSSGKCELSVSYLATIDEDLEIRLYMKKMMELLKE